MKSYEEVIKEAMDEKVREHNAKLDQTEKTPVGEVAKINVIVSMGLSVVAWVALVAWPFVPFLDFVDATCLFVISYIIGKNAQEHSDASEAELGYGPKQNLGEILIHNKVMTKILLDIKHSLSDRKDNE